MGTLLTAGEEQELQIIEINNQRMEIGLGLKQLTDSPWASGSIPAVGSRVEARVEEVGVGL